MSMNNPGGLLGQPNNIGASRKGTTLSNRGGAQEQQKKDQKRSMAHTHWTAGQIAG